MSADISALVRDVTTRAMDAYQAGHAEGFKQGYIEGFRAALDKAQELVNETLCKGMSP